MKKIALVVCMVLACSMMTYAQVYNLKKDFGAKGDGIADDSKAWNDALSALDKSKSGTLIVPAGTYIIGDQITNKNGQYVERYNSIITNAQNVKISGSVNGSGRPTSIIKYKKNLKHGIFSGKNASMGVALRFEKGRNITIENLEFDGNLPNANLGIENTKTDLWHIGVYINMSSNVLINNVHVHHFALDGIYMRAPSTPGTNITLNKVLSEYNARQGLSITAGRGVEINNSTFRYTGKSKLMISPAANIDIENHSKTAIQDIRINNCVLEDNAGGSGSLNIAGVVEGVKVYNTTITTTGLYSIQSNYSPSKDFYFENCDITGIVEMQWGSKGKSGKGKTIFKACTFTDNLNSRTAGTRRALLNTYDDVVLENCVFNLGPKRKLIHSYNNGTEKKTNAVIFTNPTVNIIKGRKGLNNSDINQLISSPNRVLIK